MGGIGYGLPHLYYWDEVSVVNRVVRFGSGDLNPHYFVYPALDLYIQFIACCLYFVLGRLTGHFHSAQDFATEYFTNPTNTYLVVRTLTALIGSLVVLATYYTGKKYFGTLVGLLGALLVAVSPLHSGQSHVAETDIPQGLFVILALGAILEVMRQARRRDYILAGLLIGLGCATKYLAVLLIPTLILAHLLHKRPASPEGAPGERLLDRLRPAHLLVSFAAMSVGFFVGTPYNILDLHGFLADWRAQYHIVNSMQNHSYSLYFLHVLPSDQGWLLLLTAVAGMLIMAYQRRPAYWLFLSFPIIYLPFMSHYALAFPRYMIPTEPCLMLAAGFTLATIFRKLRTRLPNSPIPAAALIVGLIALMAHPFYTTLRWDAFMMYHKDSRTAAREWADAHIPSGSVVAVQAIFDRTFFNAPLLTDKKLALIDSYLPSGGKLGAVRQRVFAELKQQPVYREIPFVQDLAALQSAGVEYVFVSRRMDPLSPAFEAQLTAASVGVYRFASGANDSPPLPSGIEYTIPDLPPDLIVFALPAHKP
jgi:hypothetical protein